MIMNYQKRRAPMVGKLALILFGVLVLTSYAGQRSRAPIDAEKAELMGRVEDFILHNLREAPLRRSLEWGPVITNDQGHRSIRYKCEVATSDQGRKTIDLVFAFDANGKCLRHEILETVSQPGDRQDTTRRKSTHRMGENCATVDKDGGPTWKDARAITKNTWFVGTLAGRRDERWYRLDVSPGRTYRFFRDEEFGTGRYSADTLFQMFEGKVDESTLVISDGTNRSHETPLTYRPKGSHTIYVRLISDNPGSTSFAFGYTESPRVAGEPEDDDTVARVDNEDGTYAHVDGAARFLFEDNDLDYQSIRTRTELADKRFRLTSLGLAKDDTFLYIRLVYVSPIESRVGVRLAGDELGLRKFLPYGTEIGRNVLIVQLDRRKVRTYPESICVEIGDDHSVVIDKDVVDEFLR